MATGPGHRDVTPLPDLLHGRSRAGPVRQQRPVYVDLLPPCNAGCPAGENIQAWLAHHFCATARNTPADCSTCCADGLVVRGTPRSRTCVGCLPSPSASTSPHANAGT